MVIKCIRQGKQEQDWESNNREKKQEKTLKQGQVAEQIWFFTHCG